MKRSLLVVLACGLLVAADAPKEGDAKGDLEKFKGTWKTVSGEADGNALPQEFLDDAKMTFTADKYTFTALTEEEEGTIKLDDKKKPKTIDLMITKGRDKDKKQFGIYELEGDTLKVCFAAPEQERPKEFSSKAGSGHILITLKRNK